MNLRILIPSLLLAFAVIACGGNHDHEGHDHEGHDHEHHDHDHEGHDHEHEGEAEADAGVTGNDLVVVNEAGGYGAVVTNDGDIHTADALVAKMTESGEDMESVKMTGVISACCQKKGCWMDVALADGESMKVRFKDYGFFVPMDITGKEVLLEGKAYMETIDVDMLKHYAEDAGKSQEEIDAITEPEMAIAFEAVGVLPMGE